MSAEPKVIDLTEATFSRAEDRQVPAIAPQPQENALMAIISRAAADPTYDIAKLRELLAVKKEWDADEARKAFVVALAKFKENPPEILKNIKVAFGNTKYSHAGLDQASEKIGAALALVGISHTWDIQQAEKIKVTCILTHSLGHSERVAMEGGADTSGSKNPLQSIASAISFMQRYTLFMAVGVAPKNVDDDARGGEGVHEMDGRVKVDFEAQIAALAKTKEAEALWQTIAAECTKSGDVAAYDELKKALAAKVKALKAEETKSV